MLVECFESRIANGGSYALSVQWSADGAFTALYFTYSKGRVMFYISLFRCVYILDNLVLTAFDISLRVMI